MGQAYNRKTSVGTSFYPQINLLYRRPHPTTKRFFGAFFILILLAISVLTNLL